jgi:hypothetical protein
MLRLKNPEAAGDQEESTLRIGQLAKLASVNAETLR